MASNKKLTGYVSEIDQFLQSVDREHPEKSLSQITEIVKHTRVFKLRDVPEQPQPPKKIWDKF